MKVKHMTICALLAALTAVCAQLAIPLGAVPVNLALLPLLLSALLLPSRYALACAGVYVLLGGIGLPVFAGFRGGLSTLLGPTGGFLAGYALCAWLASHLREQGLRPWLSLVLGVASCYLCGLIWLMFSSGISLSAALYTATLPFLPGDAVKIILALMLSRRLRL